MKIMILVLSLITTQAFAAEHGYGIDLYGRSYHHDLAQGARDKLNESNIGFAITSRIEYGNHIWTLDAGTFLNSYYDTAFWLGAQYRYKMFKYFEPGLMVRHWETTHGTYPDKAINKYITFSIPIMDNVRTSFIVRQSGYIAYLSIDF